MHIGGGAALEAARRRLGRIPALSASGVRSAASGVRSAASGVRSAASGVRNTFSSPRDALSESRVRSGFGLAVITPIILAGAVGASAPSAQVRDSAVTPLAAVETSPGVRSGASVVAVTKTPSAFHIASGGVSSPPPAVVVNSPGTLRIPAMALSAYRNAERMMAAAYPGCGLS